MYKTLQNRFREDLIVLVIGGKADETKRYLIKDPVSGETFEFGEEEYFLCQAMDGVASPSQIVKNFENRFKISFSEEKLLQFSAQMAELGLLESFVVNHSSYAENLDQSSYANNLIPQSEELKAPKAKSHNLFHFKLFNPTDTFKVITYILKPFTFLFKLLTGALLPGIILTGFVLWNNRFAFWQDTVSLLEPISFLKRFVIDVVSINLISKIAQGTVAVANQATVKEFGITLGFGFLPYFYISKEEFWKLNRQQQIWVFGTPLIYRLGLIVGGTLLWFSSRGSGVDLTVGALSIFHAAVASILIDGNPFWPSDGYAWLINFFMLPVTSLGRAFQLWGMMFGRRRLPKFIPWRSKIGLVVYALITVVFWIAFVIYGAVVIGAYLERNYRGSGILLFLGLCGLFCGWGWWLTQQFAVKPNSAVEQNFLKEVEAGVGIVSNGSSPKSAPVAPPSIPAPIPPQRLPNFQQKPKFQFGKLLRFLLLIGLLLAMFLPYQYHAGGDIKLLPPKKQQIVAQVNAYVQRVMYKGGDGTWIKRGTVIAQLEAIDIENEFKTTKEQIQAQRAILQKQKAELDKLLAGPKPEEIQVAKQQVEVSKSEIEATKSQVENQKVQAILSQRRLERFAPLYKEGAISLQQLDDVRRQADTDRTNKLTAQKNVKTAEKKLEEAQANLALVLSGALPQDVIAAKADIEATRAQIRRLEQQVKYLDTQIQRTTLGMPFDGRLSTPYLDRKIGSYLKEGDIFAEAEDDRNMQGEVLIPEFQVEEVFPNSKVEAKLLVYPRTPLMGRVISIAPTATEVSYGQVVKVLVEFPNSEGILKSDMSGYAKIEGSTMPTIVALTRAIVRFVQIEIWSWFP